MANETIEKLKDQLRTELEERERLRKELDEKLENAENNKLGEAFIDQVAQSARASVDAL